MSRAEPLKVSIAMATYNGEKYLQEQLDSFLAQTRLPDELVITDDCSADNTLAIIEKFAASAPFEVRWGRNEENLGYTGNFNKALMKATGDLVFLSDQDDVWFPEKLERMERYALEDPEALVVMNDAALTDHALNDTGLTKLGQIATAGMSDSSFVMGCCAAVRRELLELCLPIPAGYMGHDNWIVEMAEGVGRKRVFRDVLQCYRRHDENESQFIANRTTKVTRWMVFRHSLARAVTGDGQQEQMVQSCIQIGRFLEGVRVAGARSEFPLSNSFEAYARQLEWRFLTMERRMEMRLKARWQRLPDVINLWKSGAYSEFSGVHSAVRDLLFR